jgi:hypothetical protein
VIEYESMVEKIELLPDLQLADRQIKEGKGIEHSKAKNKFLRILPNEDHLVTYCYYESLLDS